jgi:3-carboxy-cis,cis-muconate cycloisomerase
MTTPLDSAIFGSLFSDQEISTLLNDSAFVRTRVEVEVALARAEARVGVIPEAAAGKIAAVKVESIEMAALAGGTSRSGFPIIALVKELQKQVGIEAAPFVHWGATTQDIMDTACVLQLRAVAALFKIRLGEIVRSLSSLCAAQRNTILAGRTHSQQALPITFGLKAAAWLAPLLRHLERLEEVLPRLLVVQFGGAAGTLAALGDKGLAVAQALADELKLGLPMMPWHAQRDSFVEFANWLSLVTGSLGKMAQDVILLSQTEIGEVGESAEKDRGGSSTMPQKSNPITSELIVAAARMNGSLLSALHQAQIQEQERATHGWQLEWLSLPQMIALTGGALKHASYLAENLQIDARAMRENIAGADDVILAEAAVFALAAVMPRQRAEELVKQACAATVAGHKPLIEVVQRLAAGQTGGAKIDWPALARPENYLGETERIIDRVLDAAKKVSR